ncbi:hypothetical protein RJ641_010747 [Dillenia turbinata]|uniref:Uncharacterized protein n=1 Tax=Dillenia turbinata TaxID=194707 RepID=A0AAN8V856_9MAGN
MHGHVALLAQFGNGSLKSSLPTRVKTPFSTGAGGYLSYIGSRGLRRCGWVGGNQWGIAPSLLHVFRPGGSKGSDCAVTDFLSFQGLGLRITTLTPNNYQTTSYVLFEGTP